MKRVAVVGAAGFLGSALVAELAGAYDLHAFVRTESNIIRLSQSAKKFTLHTVRADEIEKLVLECEPDIVAYCAVEYDNASENHQLKETNIRLPVALATSLSARGGTFVHFDTFYSKFTNYKHLLSYQASKRECIDQLRTLGDSVQIINARLEQVYGPQDNPDKSIASLISKICCGASHLQLSHGEQRRDFVFVTDVARAIRYLLHESKINSGGLHSIEIGTGQSSTLKEFLLQVKETSGSHTDLQFGALPYRDGEPMDSKADVSTLVALGWQPVVSLQEGIRRTVEFYTT